MTLKEFLKTTQTSPVVRAVLPIEQGMLYPAFCVTRGKLCVHFLCHRSAVGKEGLKVWPPELHFQFAYPTGGILTFQDLKYSPAFAGTDFTAHSVIPPRSQEQRTWYQENIRRLETLGNSLLEAWDEQGSADPSEYMRVLERVLTPEQTAAYRRLMGGDS